MLHVKRAKKMAGIYATCTLDVDLALALFDEHRDVCQLEIVLPESSGF